METLRLLVILLSAILCTACDPSHSLTLRSDKNNTNTSVTVYAEKGILKGDTLREPLVLKVPENTSDSIIYEKNIFQGLGKWSDNNIKALSKRIDSIHIINSSGEIKLGDTEKIFTYLSKNKKNSFMSSTIIIEAQ